MKRNFCKLLCLSLSFAMLLVMFAGCGKEPVSSPTDVTPQSVVTPLDREPTEDTTTTVSKAEASEPSSKLPTDSVVSPPSSDDSPPVLLPVNPVDKIPSSTPSKEQPKPINIVFHSIYKEQYTGNTGLGKLWKDHFGKMAEQGILTSYANADPDTVVDTITKDVMAGRASADVFEVSLGLSHQLAVKKVLANVLDSKTLNQKAFDNGGTHSNTINGKTYGVALSANANVMMILYNKELVKKYAPDVDISALIAQNKWNYDTFRDLAKKCTVDIDGNGKIDVYAIASNSELIHGSVLANAGGYGVEQQGKITSTLAKYGKGYNALEFVKSLFKTDRTWKYFGTVENCVKYFSQEQEVMLAVSSRTVLEIAKELPFACGIAPLPTEDQTTAYNAVTNAQVFVIPKTKGNRIGDIGTWLNQVAKAENALFIKQTYGMQNEAAITYQRHLKNTTANYSEGALSSQIFSMLESGVLAHFHDKTYQVIESQTQNELDEFYAPLYEE